MISEGYHMNVNVLNEETLRTRWSTRRTTRS